MSERLKENNVPVMKIVKISLHNSKVATMGRGTGQSLPFCKSQVDEHIAGISRNSDMSMLHEPVPVAGASIPPLGQRCILHIPILFPQNLSISPYFRKIYKFP